MGKRIKSATKEDIAFILRELKAAGLEVASTATVKPSENPLYSSVSWKNKGELVVK